MTSPGSALSNAAFSDWVNPTRCCRESAGSRIVIGKALRLAPIEPIGIPTSVLLVRSTGVSNGSRCRRACNERAVSLSSLDYIRRPFLRRSADVIKEICKPSSACTGDNQQKNRQPKRPIFWRDDISREHGKTATHSILLQERRIVCLEIVERPDLMQTLVIPPLRGRGRLPSEAAQLPHNMQSRSR